MIEDASNSLGLEFQAFVRMALHPDKGARPGVQLCHGRQFTPEEVNRALNAARRTLYNEAHEMGVDCFELAIDPRT